jgi:hypothetical protein
MPHHAVRFYENDKPLARIVAQFLSAGLAAGNPAIVIATPRTAWSSARCLRPSTSAVEAEYPS